MTGEVVVTEVELDMPDPQCTPADLVHTSCLLVPRHVHAERISDAFISDALYVGLEHIDLAFCLNLSDFTVRRISDTCRNLQKLNLRGCERITNKSLHFLAVGSCRKLRAVDFRGCPRISKEGLWKLITAQPGLTQFLLQGCVSFDDTAVMHLTKTCKRLSHVTFCGCAVTGTALRHLGNCPQLAHVEIGEGMMTDFGLRQLANGCSKLRHIEFTQCQSISDAGLKSLGETCRVLTTIIFADCGFSDTGLQALVSAGAGESVIMLTLRRCKKITDKGLCAVAQSCQQLKTVDLTRCQRITDAGVQHLASNCPDIIDLTLQGCNGILDDSVAHVAQGCPKLTRLDLSACGLLTDQSTGYLAKCLRGLAEIDLSETSLTDSGIKYLASGCGELTTFVFRRGELITDRGIQRLAVGCPKLIKVDLSDCAELTDLSLEHLTKCTDLRELGIASGEKPNRITNAGLEHLANLPQLTAVDLSHCSQLTALPKSLVDLPALKDVETVGCHGILTPSVMAREEGVEAMRRFFVLDNRGDDPLGA